MSNRNSLALHDGGRRSLRILLAVAALGGALLANGCADQGFLPPPENLPYGESSSEPEAQPLQPPPDL
jgi:hypothetical protein